MKKNYPLFILFIFTSLLASCGDDDKPTNTPGGTVLYSKDSISVWLSPSTFSEGADSVYYSTSNAVPVRVEFTLQSNADSTHSLGYWFFITNSTPPEPYVPNIFSPVDEQKTFTLNFNPLSTYFSFAVRLRVNNSTILHYVKLKNIKVTTL